jgi:cysteine synthase
LKYKNSNIKIIAYEPASSPVYSGGKQGKYTHIGVGPGFLHDCVATLAAKLEMFNPLSVKGRPVLYMIEEAERNGFINKDTTIIEASRGYTGVALTFICSVPFLLIQGRDIFPYKVFFKIGVFKVRYFCLGNLISSS